jgi:hypothetical protein
MTLVYVTPHYEQPEAAQPSQQTWYVSQFATGGLPHEFTPPIPLRVWLIPHRQEIKSNLALSGTRLPTPVSDGSPPVDTLLVVDYEGSHHISHVRVCVALGLGPL